MVVILTFKTPDLDMQIDEPDREDEESPTRREIMEKLSKWVEYSEYVRIEFDLETMKAKVIERK